MKNKRRVAIVTAAGRGIGAACARELAEQQYAVALMSPSGASVKLATELGGVGLSGSVTNSGDLKKLVELAVKTYGRIDVVVNNTGHTRWTIGVDASGHIKPDVKSGGVSGGPRSGHDRGLGYDPELDGGLLEITDDDWCDGFDMFLLNVVRMARLVTPIMLQWGRGAIVNISTFAAFEPRLIFPISSTIRAALGGFTKIYSDRYARQGIRMNNVLPGYVDNMPIDEEIRKIIPMARPCTMAEVAKTAAFLLSDAAGYITGQNILVDGGINRRL